MPASLSLASSLSNGSERGQDLKWSFDRVCMIAQTHTTRHTIIPSLRDTIGKVGLEGSPRGDAFLFTTCGALSLKRRWRREVHSRRVSCGNKNQIVFDGSKRQSKRRIKTPVTHRAGMQSKESDLRADISEEIAWIRPE